MTSQAAQVLAFRPRAGQEAWVTKPHLAAHLGMSERWIEMRVRDGMPSQRFGRSRRFRISEVESWLAGRSA